MSEIVKNIVDRANRNVNSTVFAADEVLVLAAEIQRLTTALENARKDALEEAAAKVREDCPACSGSGHAGPEEECQYCGIPMRAVLELLTPPTEKAT